MKDVYMRKTIKVKVEVDVDYDIFPAEPDVGINNDYVAGTTFHNPKTGAEIDGFIMLLTDNQLEFIEEQLLYED
jgi:hypothetical protein